MLCIQKLDAYLKITNFLREICLHVTLTTQLVIVIVLKRLIIMEKVSKGGTH